MKPVGCSSLLFPANVSRCTIPVALRRDRCTHDTSRTMLADDMRLVFAARAFGQRRVKLVKLLQIRRHRIVLVCFARFAPAPSPIVLADAPPPAIPALAPSPIVLADAPPSALLALALLPIVLALPWLPPSCSLPSPAVPALVSVWRRPLPAALASLLIPCPPTAFATHVLPPPSSPPLAAAAAPPIPC